MYISLSNKKNNQNDNLYNYEAHVDIIHYLLNFLMIAFVLNSCDRLIISNGIINVDFHFIKDRCSCAFESNVSVLYYLSNYPRFDCGTGINITQSDSTTRIL